MEHDFNESILSLVLVISREGQRYQFHFNFVTQTYMFKMFIIVTKGTEVEWLLAEGEKMKKDD